MRLVDASDGRQLWSERYEREVADAFAAQDELVELIVSGIAGRIDGLRGGA